MSATDQALRDAQDNYLLVQRKLSEAQLKSSTTYTAQSMQVVARAPVPFFADGRKAQAQMALSGIGGLVAGVLVALVLNAVGPRIVIRVRRTRRWMRPSAFEVGGLVLGVLIGALVRAIARF